MRKYKVIYKLYGKAKTLRATKIIDNIAKVEHKVPKEKRIKCFEVKRDEGLLDEIKQRVTEAREIFDDLYLEL